MKQFMLTIAAFFFISANHSFAQLPPDAYDDSAYYVYPTETLPILVLNNDFYDLPVTVSVGQPMFGNTIVDPIDNLIYYTFVEGSGAIPPFSYDYFTYYLCSNGICDSAMVWVSLDLILLPDSAIYAQDDYGQFGFNTSVSVNVLNNDYNATSAPLTLSIVTAPNFGAVNIEDGEILVYTPNTNSVQTDMLIYEVCNGFSCDVANLYLYFYPSDTIQVNIPPITLDFEQQVCRETFTEQYLSANYYDYNYDSLQLTITQYPQHANLTASYYTYWAVTPTNDGFIGTDTLRYIVCEVNTPEDYCTEGIIVFTITDCYPPVTAQYDYANIYLPDSITTIAVLANDLLDNLESVSITDVGLPLFGTAVINPDNTITYTADNSLNVNYDYFTYTICDTVLNLCSEAYVSISIGVDYSNFYIAYDDWAYFNFNEPVILTPLENDNAADSAYITLITAPVFGIATLNADNTITYSPNINSVAGDQFSYIACRNEQCDTANIVVTFNFTGSIDENIPPITYPGYFTACSETPEWLFLYPNYYDYNNDFTEFSITQQPQHGTFSTDIFFQFQYTPYEGYVGFDTIRYTVCETTTPELYCTEGFIVIEMLDCYNSVEAFGDYANIYFQQPSAAIDVVANDYADSGITLSLSNIVATPQYGTLAINDNGTLQYTLNEDIDTSLQYLYDYFDYIVCGSNGICDTASVYVSIDSYSLYTYPYYLQIEAGTSYTFSPVFDFGFWFLDTLTVAGINALPTDGISTSFNPTDQTITISVDSTFTGVSYSFEYTLCGQFDVCETVQVYVYIQDYVPLEEYGVFAQDDYIELPDSSGYAYINVGANDAFPVIAFPFPSYYISEYPQNGNLENLYDGTFLYSSDNVQLADTFRYVVCLTDVFVCDTATVYLSSYCNGGCIWPGDVNRDGIANNFDVLALGLAYSTSGTARTNASSEWKGQTCPDWDINFAYNDPFDVTININSKFADCNGDGTVNDDDLAVIDQNYNFTHAKNQEEYAIEEEAPFMIIEMLQSDLVPGAWAEADILIGSAELPVQNLYGTAFILQLPDEAGDVQVLFNDTWLGTESESTHIVKKHGSKLELAFSRTNHTNVSGYGKIARLRFWVNETALPNTQLQTNIIVAGMMNTEGEMLLFNTQSATATITNIANPQESVLLRMFPNPASSEVIIESVSEPIQAIRVYDATGKLVFTAPITTSTVQYNLQLNDFLNGWYIVELKTNNSIIRQRLVVQK